MSVSGSVISSTVTVSKSGKTVLSMKEIGGLTKPAAKVNFGTLMATYLKANGLTIRLTDMASTFIKTVHDMKVSGKMICSTAKEKKFGPIIPCMKAIIMRAKSTEKVFIFGKMDPDTREIGTKTRNMDMVSSHM